MLLFGLLNTQSVQEYIKDELVKELKHKLDTDLGIESLSIQPFKIIQLNGIYLNDRNGDTILNAKKIYADFDILPLLDKQIIISAARINDFDIALSKENKEAPLNIQFIIDAFKPKEDTKQQKFELHINALNIANGNFRFDIKDQPEINNQKFDPNHIHVSDFNSKLALKSLDIDSLNIEVKKLSLKEKSGFEVKNMIVRLISEDKELQVKGFELNLPHSHLEFEKCRINLSAVESAENQKKIDNITFETKITDSYISPKDISAFVPSLKYFNDRILFNAQIEGNLNDIKVSSLKFDYGDKVQLQASGQIKDVLNSNEKLYLKGRVSRLYLTQSGILSLLDNLSDEKKNAQQELLNLGTIEFNGTIDGYINQLKASGHLQTELGNLDANVDMGFTPKEAITAFYKGKLSTTKFDLKKLLNNKDFGNTSFDLTLDLKKPKEGKLGGLVEGDIYSFDFKNYTYKDIAIDGQYDGLKVEGLLDIDDENGSLRIDGLFDLSKKEPELNFHAKLKNIRLDKLNLANKYKEPYLSLDINANFTGKNLDNLQGYIAIDSITFIQSGKYYKMDEFLIKASGFDDDRKLTLESDIVNGQVSGNYSFSTIVNSLKRSFNKYLPSLVFFKESKKNRILKNDLSFDFTINNTEDISDVLQLPFNIYSPAKIVGYYNNEIERFKLESFIPSAFVGGSKLESGYIKIENDAQKINSTISGIFVTKNKTRNNLSVNIEALKDSVHLNTSFLNEDQTKLKGILSNSFVFSKIGNSNSLQTEILIDAGQMVLNNSIWNIKKSNITILPQNIDVNNFEIINTDKDQQLRIDGTYSTEEENTKELLIHLKNIDLEYIFNTLAIDALEFEGSANGNLAVSSIEGKPYAEINLSVDQFGFNKTKLGQLNLASHLDPLSNKVGLKGQITNKNNKITQISGSIDPITQQLSIYFDSDEVDIAFLNKYASSLFNDIKGTGIGDIHLFGNFSEVTVEGKAYIENGELGINFLNTRYNFSDTVYLKQDLIYFNDLTLHDRKGNSAQLSGKVVHDYFSNFIYYVELRSENFLLYNATSNTNPIFYGTLFGSGYGTIKGDEHSVDIDVNLQTRKGTYLHMDFMEDAATEYSFITYKQKDTSDNQLIQKRTTVENKEQNSEMNINMNFYIDATPDATVELLMDPIGGDKLKGTGSGTMQFVWGTNKDPLLYGTYQIYNGSYNFTFQKILERKFSIQEGSYVQFSGDPFQANLDVTAKYRVVANLFDLDKNLVSTTGQTSIPVYCLLNLTGPLIHPLVKLDIELPSTDSEIARQIKNLINSEDMMNRQIAYLLILSKFYTPNYADTDHRTNDFASFASATLSTQLGNILSSIDDRWQIGTNIRTSDSNFSSTEVELLLSSRLLNDRVLFNGNFGYRDNPLTQDALIGDVDVEVLLNNIGTWRLKAYNHYNEKFYYINNSSIQTQGVGLMYKRDFDNFKDLFKRTRREKTIVELEDSIRSSSHKLDSIGRDSILLNRSDSTLLSSRSFIKMKQR